MEPGIERRKEKRSERESKKGLKRIEKRIEQSMEPSIDMIIERIPAPVPAVTVLMPAYNTEKYIAEAIRSVLEQHFSDFELLIINDGSTDGTEAIIRSFKDPRIVLVTQANQGVSAALNTGLRQARGRFIARFDADDTCYPDRLRKQYDFMAANPDYVLIGSDADYVDQEGEPLFYYSNIGHSYEEILEKIGIYCPFVHSTVFYRKDIVLELGGYEPKAHTFEDWLLWMQFIKKGKALNVREALIAVRLNPESVTVDEKLRGKRFSQLKKEILTGGLPITDVQEKELKRILKSQDFSAFKHYSYYILVAKKYLWNNYNPARSRRHSAKAIGLKPFLPGGYLLFLLSLLPERTLRYLHKKSKG
ncbi:MAG: glycosyltransferase [Puia sp.]|nr:glycosyltransferase [Puia sp.]